MLYLADKSAYEQQRHSAEADRVLRTLTAQGALAMCEIVALELLYSSRSRDDYERRDRLLRALPWLHVTQAIMERSLGLQRELADTGHHRRPIPDLILAATALEHDATILHYDRDFDLIAQVTGQPVLWIVPRGTGHGNRP